MDSQRYATLPTSANEFCLIVSLAALKEIVSERGKDAATKRRFEIIVVLFLYQTESFLKGVWFPSSVSNARENQEINLTSKTEGLQPRATIHLSHQHPIPQHFLKVLLYCSDTVRGNKNG